MMMMLMMMIIMIKPAPGPYKGTAGSRSHHNDVSWARNTKYVDVLSELLINNISIILYFSVWIGKLYQLVH
jgi:hypothetical protein